MISPIQLTQTVQRKWGKMNCGRHQLVRKVDDGGARVTASGRGVEQVETELRLPIVVALSCSFIPILTRIPPLICEGYFFKEVKQDVRNLFWCIFLPSGPESPGFVHSLFPISTRDKHAISAQGIVIPHFYDSFPP